MADIGYTYRAKDGTVFFLLRASATAKAILTVRATSGVDISVSLGAEELGELAGGMAIVRDYR